MAGLGDMFVTVGADISGFSTAMGNVNDKLREATREAGNATRGWGEMFSSLQSVGLGLTASITAPLAGISLAAVGVSEQLGMANLGFTTMLGSAEAASSFLGELKTFATSTPFEFPELVTAAQRMMAMGFEAGQVIPTLTIIGDSVAALGGDAQMIDRVTLALGQMQAKGKVSAQEMNQLAESGIPAWQLLADKIGLTIPEAMKLAEKGAIAASEAVPAILAGMQDKFGGQMEAASKTLTGVWSNFKDQATFVLGDIGTTLSPILKDLVTNVAAPLLGWAQDMAAAFKDLNPGVQTGILVFGGLFAAAGPLLLAVGTLGQAFIGVQTAVAVIGPLLTTVGGAFATLATGITTGIGAVLGTFIVTTIPAFVAGVGNMVIALTLNAAQAFAGLAVTSIPQLATAIVSAGASFITFAAQGVASAVSAIGSFAVTSIPAAVAAVVGFVTTTIPAAIASFVSFATAGVGSAITALTALSVTALPYVAGAVAIAAAAFAAWKLFEWAKDLPIVQAAIGSVGEVINWLVEQLKRIPGVTSLIDSLKTAAGSMSNVFLGAKKPTDDLASAFDALGVTSAAKAKKHIDDLKKAVDDVDAAFKIGNATVGDVKAAHDALAKAVAGPKGSTKAHADAKKPANDLAIAFGKLGLKSGGTKTKIGELQDAVKDIERAWQDGKVPIGDYQRALGVLHDEANKTKVHDLEKQVKDLNQSYKDGLISTGEYTAKQKSLTDQIALLSPPTITAKASVAALEEALGNLDTAMISNTPLITGNKDAQALLNATIAGMKVDKPIEVLGTLSTAVGTMTTTSKGYFDTFSSDVGNVFASFGGDSLKALFSGEGSLGERFKSLFSGLGESLLNTFLRPAESALNDFMNGVIKDLLGGKGFGGILDSVKSLGKGIADIFGGSAGAVGDIAGGVNAGLPGGALGTIGGAGGSAGGAAGSVAGAASSGLAGIVGAVGSVVSAVSGVIGNFQFMAMNKSLDLIEHEVRFTKILTEQTKADHWLRETHQMLKLDDLWSAIRNVTGAITGGVWEKLDWLIEDGRALLELQAIGMSQMIDQLRSNGIDSMARQQPMELSAAGGGGVTFVLNNPHFLNDRAVDEFMETAVRRMKQRNA